MLRMILKAPGLLPLPTRAPVLVTVYLKWEIASRNYGLLLFSLLCSIPLHPATRSLPGLLPTLYPNTRPIYNGGMGKSVIAGRLRATFARNHNYT